MADIVEVKTTDTLTVLVSTGDVLIPASVPGTVTTSSGDTLVIPVDSLSVVSAPGADQLITSQTQATFLETAIQGAPGPIGQPGTAYASVNVVPYSANISIDLSALTATYDLTLAGNAVVNFINGSPALDGKRVMLRVRQDATGSRAVTWGSSIHFGSDIAAVALTSAANALDYVGFMYYHARVQCDVTAFARSY